MKVSLELQSELYCELILFLFDCSFFCFSEVVDFWREENVGNPMYVDAVMLNFDISELNFAPVALFLWSFPVQLTL